MPVSQDSLDKIAFDGVDRHCKWLGISSREVVHFIKLLVAQRPFETLAEENMDNAEKALKDAIQSIQEARAYYKALPKENKPA